MSEDDPWAEDAAFLAEVMIATYERRKPQARGGAAQRSTGSMRMACC